MITKKTLLQLPEDLHRAMKAEAAKAGLTINDYINKLIQEKVRRAEKNNK